MEAKIEDYNLLSMRRANEKAPEVIENSSLVISNNPEIREEKTDSAALLNCQNAQNGILTQKTDKVTQKAKELQSPKQSADPANICQQADKELKVKASNLVLKRKLTEDGVTIERVLSEGEASSGFETVSSIDSKLSFEDFDLISESEQDYNVIVKIKNDFADNKHKNSNGRGFFWKDKNISPDRSYRRSEHCVGKYINQRHDNIRSYRQSQYFERFTMYHGRDRGSRKKEFYKCKTEVSHYHKWRRNSDSSRRSRSKCSDQSRRSWESKCSDQSRRSWESKCCDQSLKLKGSGYIYTNRSSYRRSSERYSRSKSPSFKARKIESRHSRSLEKSKLNFSRNSPSRKRQNYFSKSPPTSTWKRLDNYATTNRLKKHHINRFLRHSFSSEGEEGEEKRKKEERSERKRQKERTPFLLELEKRLKEADIQRNATKEPNLPPEQIKTPQNVSFATSSTEAVKCQNLNSEFSSNYLLHTQNPLGMYPLQWTQRPTKNIDKLPLMLGQVGLPVHVTESGETVLHDMKLAQSNVVSVCRQTISTVPQTKQTTDKDMAQNKNSDVKYPNSPDPQPPAIESNLLGVIPNSNAKTNKADLLIKYQKRARERNEDARKCKEIEKNLGVNPSKGGIKRSIPTKISQKKTSKDEDYSEIITISDSNDSNSAGPKSLSETKKDSLPLADELAKISDDVEDTSKLSCDNESSKTSSLESSSEDFIIKKVQKALISLRENNVKPPALGRFIISQVVIYPVKETSPNVSPLLRNRIKLPFVTPNSEKYNVKEKPTTAKKATTTFKFLSEEISVENGEKPIKLSKPLNKNFTATKFPVFTFDFAMQCDFTTVIIQNLTSKVAEMEMEVVRLRNINANLLDSYRNIHEANEKKDEELAKALLEIEKRNKEIVSLKSIISEKGT